MFEFLSIVCTAAALSQGSCMPDGAGAGGPFGFGETPRPDSYEMRVAPGMYQLSYAGRGDRFDRDHLVAHWRRRASQLCAGDYAGMPMAQTSYPDPGYDALVTFLPLSGTRTYNTEVYGVAHCADGTR